MKRLSTFKDLLPIVATILLASTLILSSCETAPVENDYASLSSTKDATITNPIENPCMEVCLVAGQHMYVGSVYAGYSGDDLQVMLEVTAGGVYLEEIHVDVFADLDQFDSDKKLSNGGAIPGKFKFKKSWNESAMVTSYTVTIPKSYLDQKVGDADCFYIAAHAALSNGETAWGGICEDSDKGVSLASAEQFPGKNWGTFFEFCKDACNVEVDFTYAWEDKNQTYAEGNDGDYNDLVIKSNVVKSASQLHINLYAVARGASYDHAFKIMIPKLGVVDGMGGIFGADLVEEDGGNYILTIFPSTAAVLPGEDGDFATNTRETDTDCDPKASADITIYTDGSFVFNPDHPYYPFITVHPGQTNAYDLNIYELAPSGEGDFWIGEDGNKYPNGIIIPYDWKWPYEKTFIGLAYGSFTSLSDGFTANWYNNLTDPSKVFDVECE